MEGQISIFDFLQQREINKKNECLGEPCMYCDVEWCSLVCFIRRGYVWDPMNRFIKNEDGLRLRIPVEDRQCKEKFGEMEGAAGY